MQQAARKFLEKPFPLFPSRKVGAAILGAAGVIALIAFFILFKKVIVFSLMILIALFSPWYLSPELFFSIIISHTLGFFPGALFLVLINALRAFRYGTLPTELTALFFLLLAFFENFLAMLMRSFPVGPVTISLLMGNQTVNAFVSFFVIRDGTVIGMLLTLIWLLANIFYATKFSHALSALLS